MKSAFAILFFIAVNSLYGQKILLIDDDTYSKPDHYPRVKNAIALAVSEKNGYELTEYTAGINDELTFEQARNYELIIWYCGNTGVGTHLWNENKTDNALIPQLIKEGITVWIIGNDFLLDRYGNAPKEFAAGDFAYDILGIKSVVGESKKDDGDMGLPYIISNTIEDSRIDTLRWADNLWYADACTLKDNVQTFYTMAPDDYMFAGKSIMWMNKSEKGDIMVSAFDPWFIEDTEDLNLFFSYFIGNTITNIEEQTKSAMRFFPNPASDFMYCYNIPVPSTGKVTLTDMVGNRIIKEIQMSDENRWEMNVREIPSGVYTVNTDGTIFNIVVCR